jgi:hypothetical protein
MFKPLNRKFGIKFFLLLVAISSTAASPRLKPRPNNPYFADFQPVQGPSYSGLILKNRDRLAICGDSITEQKMYSRLIEDYLTMCTPQPALTILL